MGGTDRWAGRKRDGSTRKLCSGSEVRKVLVISLLPWGWEF